jgi:hypothetical protein
MPDWTKRIKEAEAKAQSAQQEAEAASRASRAEYDAYMSTVHKAIGDVVLPALKEVRDALISEGHMPDLRVSPDNTGVEFEIRNLKGVTLGRGSIKPSVFKIEEVQAMRKLFWRASHPSGKEEHEHIAPADITGSWVEQRLERFIDLALSSPPT